MNRLQHASFPAQWRAEQKKCRYRNIWLIPFGFLAFEILWVFWQLRNSSPEDLQTGYLMLFYNFPMINTIILPIMVAVIASRLCDMEIKGDTLKLLYTVQKNTDFYNCKYLTGLKYLLLFPLAQSILIMTAGQIYHFGDSLNPVRLLENAAVVFVVSAALLCIQQMLSLFSDNQILPLVVGLCGSFLGLFSMFFPTGVARLILWGYYAAFPSVGMNWDPDTRFTEYFEINFPLQSFLLFLLFTIVLYFACRTVITRKEA